MLRIAVPNKGSLAERAIALLQEAGYSPSRADRELFVGDAENEVEFFFLRPRDIATYVGDGLLDIGITGRDLALDNQAEVLELLPLGFAKAAFCFAVPVESELTPEQFGGLRIATSYPNLVARGLAQLGVSAKIVRLDGAVEIALRLGVADAIADVVQSGRTLTQAGLKIVGEPVVKSEAILIGRNAAVAEREDVVTLIERLKGILLAAEYCMIEYDIQRAQLEPACQITPGLESPTISPLNKPDWVAVKAMIQRRRINQITDELKQLGAKGIIVTDIRTCRL